MGMHTYEKLRDMLCEELEDYAEKNELSAGSLEVIHKLTDTIKNIDKIECLEENGYSMDGDWEMEGRGFYASRDGRGDNRDGRGYSRDGDYFRDGNYSMRRSGRRRDSMGRYSRNGSKEEMMAHIDEMMEAAPDEQTKEMIRAFKKEINKA